MVTLLTLICVLFLPCAHSPVPPYVRSLPNRTRPSHRGAQVKILGRMRGLGMTPVLSAFAGHVPAAFKAAFPSAKITRSPDWANFDAGNPATAACADVCMIDPADPLYIEVGSKHIESQAQIFGTDHIYNCDTCKDRDTEDSSQGHPEPAPSLTPFW